MPSNVRTRIAPSPTGFLHLGTARTALFSWAYARHFGCEFVLRIEDTDVARSADDAVAQILTSMHWLGLNYDEGPVYQMQRLARYHDVAQQLIASGHAYCCYCTPDELEATREAQRQRGEKTHYDGRWRPAPGKTLPSVPAGVNPVVRFCNPRDGTVRWDDLVKGPIAISNTEIDDLIILRPAHDGDGGLGVPTYNFAVVVDDWDMRITHVFRGDEHINNTPWQINIFRALGAPLPLFGHCPIILGDDGLKLSKRRGAVSVTAYEDAGYLPEAMLNYLARLGWSHGDDEIFSREQFLQWFSLDHLGKSAAQFDEVKLRWVNAQHLKSMADDALATLVTQQLAARAIATDARLPALCGLLKDRCDTTVALADWIAKFYRDVQASPDELAQHVTPTVSPALALLADKLGTCEWSRPAIAASLKEVLADTGLKMPQLAMAVRVLVLGTAQTPSLDAVLALLTREQVQDRLKSS